MGYIYGLDISKHNGSLDFDSIKKAGNDFVIIRAGYGKEISQKDPKFEEYYKQAKAKGLKVGVYWYSYALSSSDAKKEAQACLEVIKGKQFEYPVYIDMEDADGYKKEHGMPSNAALCDICEVFCDMLEKAGYYAGIYASESWFNNQLKSVNSRYDKWLANWGDNDDLLENNELKTLYRLHQYTSNYKLNGKRFDRNVVYSYDYPKVIKDKGLNGFGGGSKPSEPSKQAIEEDGKWGPDTTKLAQKVFGTEVDGIVSNQPKSYEDDNTGLLSSTFKWEKPCTGYSPLIKAIQKWEGMPEDERDGRVGPNTIKYIQRKLGTPADGHFDYGGVGIKAFQKYLNSKA